GVGGSVSDAALQPDGKILLSGTDGGKFAVMRLNANGSLDTSLGGTGWVTTDLSSASGNRAYAVAVAPDGKIVVAGVTGQGYGGTTRLLLQTDGRIVVAGTAGTFQANTIRGRFVRLSPAGVLENRADSAWTTSTTQGVAQDATGNIYLAYNYGSNGSSGYVDR